MGGGGEFPRFRLTTALCCQILRFARLDFQFFVSDAGLEILIGFSSSEIILRENLGEPMQTFSFHIFFAFFLLLLSAVAPCKYSIHRGNTMIAYRSSLRPPGKTVLG